jgi:hypothetical protein
VNIEILPFKPIEYFFADDDSTVCEVCERTIHAGAPFMIRRTVVREGENYALNVVRECLRPCSSTTESESEPQSRPAGSLGLDPSVVSLPDEAGIPEAGLLFRTKKAGIWVARGYERIGGFTTSHRDFNFIVCNAKQIQRKAFILDDQHLAPAKPEFGEYRAYRTRDGMNAREYITDSELAAAGEWSMPLEYIVCEQSKGKTKAATS